MRTPSGAGNPRGFAQDNAREPGSNFRVACPTTTTRRPSPPRARFYETPYTWLQMPEHVATRARSSHVWKEENEEEVEEEPRGKEKEGETRRVNRANLFREGSASGGTSRILIYSSYILIIWKFWLPLFELCPPHRPSGGGRGGGGGTRRRTRWRRWWMRDAGEQSGRGKFSQRAIRAYGCMQYEHRCNDTFVTLVTLMRYVNM